MQCGGPPCGASNSRHVNCDVRAPHLSCSFRYLRVTSWNGSYIVSCSTPCGEETNTPEVTGAREVTVNGRSSPSRLRTAPLSVSSTSSSAQLGAVSKGAPASAVLHPSCARGGRASTPHATHAPSPPRAVARLSQLPWRPLARRPPPAPLAPSPPLATCLHCNLPVRHGRLAAWCQREVALCKAPARPLTRLTTHPIDPMPYLHRPFPPLQPLGETTGRG